MKKPDRSIFNERPQSSGLDSIFRHYIFKLTLAVIISTILVIFLYNVTIPTQVLAQGNVTTSTTVNNATGTSSLFPFITKSTQTNGSSSSNSKTTATSTTPGLTSHSTSTPTNASTNNFSTYENSTYGIKISYPSDWTKEQSHNQSSTDIVFFSSPPSSAAYALLGLTTSRAHHLPLYQLTSVSIYDLKNQFNNFTLISSNATTLAGVPAQKIVYEAVYPSGLKLKIMQLITIKNDTSFVITAGTLPQDFSTSLPTLQKMIDSFTFIPVSTTIMQSTASNITSNAATSGSLSPASTSSNNIYTNHTDGISLAVPQGWGVEAGQNAANYTLLAAIRMSPPISQDPNLLVNVNIFKDTQPTTNNSLTQYLRDEVDGLRSGSTVTNFKLISASTDVPVAGHPGYQFQGSFTSSIFGPTKALETGFLLGNNAYYLTYTAPPNLYSTLLPQVNGILQSMKVNPP